MTEPRRARIEVLMCTYNGERFVAEQLESILAQTRPVDALSIFDDASTDGTLAALAGALRRHAQMHGMRVPVHVTVRPLNQGYGANFWQAVQQSSGDVLLFSDQDDVWHRAKVQCLEAAFDDPSVFFAFSDGDVIDAGGTPLGRKSVLASHGLSRRDKERFANDPLRQLLKRNCINGAAAAVRGSLARSAPPLPRGMPHDHWLAMWCCAQGQRVKCLPDRLYGYRQHGSNVIGIGHQKRRWWLAGLWRSAWASRERERWLYDRFAEWQRLPVHGDTMRRIAEKSTWLVGLVDRQHSAFRTAWRIGASLVAGRYRRFATTDALLRDVCRLTRAP